MEGLAQIREGISCLQAVPTASVSDDELAAAMVEFHRLESLLAAQRARFVEAVDLRKLWRNDWSKALWAWLSRRCDSSAGGAKSIVALAKRLRLAPRTKDAFESSDIDRDRAVELAKRAASARKRVADTFPEAENELLGHAKTMPFDSLCRVLRYWESVVDEDGEEAQGEDDYLYRNLHASEILRGMVRVDGTLDPLGGAIFTRELCRLEREMFEADWAAAKAEHGTDTRPQLLARTPAQRRADALVEMAKRSAAFSGRTDSDGLPRPLVVVHCGEATVARMCELASGTVIAPGLVVPYLGEADIERIVYGPEKRVIELSKRARCFTGGLRRAIEHRDRWCAHPGCNELAEDCQIDHKTPHSQDGETTQENGLVKCDTHNRWAWNHEQRYGSSSSGLDPPPDNTR